MKNLLEHVKGYLKETYYLYLLHWINFSEENNDLPKFEKAITAELSASLAQTFQQAKMSVAV
jgi:hypothetical protein